MVTAVLLCGALIIAFLRLDLGDGTYDAALAMRYLGGARLYQDVVVLQLPWSIYVNAGLIRLFSASVLTVNLAVLASGLALAGCLGWIVFEETWRSRSLTAVCVVFATFLGIYHWPMHGYGWNAVLLSTLAITALVWSERRSTRVFTRTITAPGIAGLMLGTAVGFKQNIGGLMLVAMLAWLVHRALWREPRSLRSTAHEIFAFATGAAVPLAMLIAIMGRAHLTDVLWHRAKIYVEWQTVAFFSNFRPPMSLVSVPKWMLEQSTLVLLAAGVVAVALVLGLQILRCAEWSGPRHPVLNRLANDGKAGRWAIVFVGSFATIFPRADYAHVAFAVPLCFAALTILVARTVGPDPAGGLRVSLDRGVVGALAALSVLLASEMGAFVVASARGDVVILAEFPGRRMIASRETVDFLHDVRHHVADGVAPGEQLLIAHRYACFLYPYLGVANPIRFDGLWDGIPTSAELDEIMQRLEVGQIHAMLIDDAPSARFAPLLRYAEQHMHARARIRRFVLFHRR